MINLSQLDQRCDDKNGWDTLNGRDTLWFVYHRTETSIAGENEIKVICCKHGRYCHNYFPLQNQTIVLTTNIQITMTEQEEDEAFWHASYIELNSVQIEARTQLISVQRSNQRLSVGRVEQTGTGGEEEEGKEKCSPPPSSTQSKWKRGFLMLQKAHDETNNRLSRARELNERLQNDASIARARQTETEECPAKRRKITGNLITNHPASGDTANVISTIDKVGDKTTKDNDDTVLDPDKLLESYEEGWQKLVWSATSNSPYTADNDGNDDEDDDDDDDGSQEDRRKVQTPITPTTDAEIVIASNSRALTSSKDADLGLPSFLTSEQKEEEKEEKETNASSSSTMASSVPLKKRKCRSLLNSQTGITDGKNGIKEGGRGVKEDSKKAMKITDGNVEGTTRKRKKGNKSKKKRNKSGGDDGDSSGDESSSSSSSSSASFATSSDEEQINFRTQQEIFHYIYAQYESCVSSNSVIATSLRTYQGRARPDVENSDQSCGSISSTLIRDHVKSVAKNNQGLSTGEITNVIDEGFLPMHFQFECVHEIDQLDVLEAGGLMKHDQYDLDTMYCYYWEPEAIQSFFTKIHRLKKPAGVCICFQGHMVTVLTYPTTNANRYLFIEPFRHRKKKYGFSVASNEVDGITSTIMFWMLHLMLEGSDPHNIPFDVKFETRSDCHERNKVGLFVISNKSETTVTSQLEKSKAEVWEDDNDNDDKGDEEQRKANTSISPVSIHDPIQAMLDDNKAMDTIVSSILHSKNTKNLKAFLESVCERNNVDPNHLTREQSSRIKDFIVKRCHDALHAASTKSDTKKPAPSLCCAKELCQHQDKNIMDRNGHKCIRCKKYMHDYSCSDEKVKDIDRMTCKKCADNLTLIGRKSKSKLKGRPNSIRNRPRTRSQGQKDNVNAKDVTEEEKEKKTGAARIAAIARGGMVGSTRSQRRAANNTKDVAKEGKDEKAMQSNKELKDRPRTRLQTQKDNANVKDAIEKEKETRVAVIARGGMAGSTRSQRRAAINESNDINESNEINDINESNEINPVEPRIIFSRHTRSQRQKDNVNAKDENEKEKETGAAGITAIARGGMAGSTRSQRRAAINESNDINESNEINDINESNEINPVEPRIIFSRHTRSQRQKDNVNAKDENEKEKETGAAGITAIARGGMAGSTRSQKRAAEEGKDETTTKSNNESEIDKIPEVEVVRTNTFKGKALRDMKHHKGSDEDDGKATMSPPRKKAKHCNVDKPPAASGLWASIRRYLSGTWLWNSTMPSGTEEKASIDKDYTDNDNNSFEQAFDDLTDTEEEASIDKDYTNNDNNSVGQAFDDLNNEDFSDFPTDTEEEASIDDDSDYDDNNNYTSSCFTETDNDDVKNGDYESDLSIELQAPQKRGMKKGATWTRKHSQDEWYDCVDLWETKIRGTRKLSQKGFLQHPISGLEFEGTSSEESGFSHYYKKYKLGWNPYKERKRKAEEYELEQRKKKKRRKKK